MSAFSPNIRLTLPPVAPDVRAESVLHALRRGVHPKLTWRGRTFVPRALLTGGLGPLLTLPRRFQIVTAADHNQFDLVADWLGKHTPDRPPDCLIESAQSIGTKTPLTPLAVTCGVVGCAIGIYYVTLTGISFASVFSFLAPFVFPINSQAPPAAMKCIVAYEIVLTIGFVFQWLAINRHIAAVQKFGACVNGIGEHDDVDPVRLPPRIFGFRLLWVAVGIAGALCGAFWALPMMLAGATHARYTVIEGRVFRAELADRFREIVALRRPVRDPI